jgi:L-ascorbate metabolism protein UlaG (beta-lactamase superfamily)
VRVTKFSHSCVRIDGDGSVLVVDPGTLSERAALDGVDAVLITHEHSDHLDVDALADVLAKRPSVAVWTHPDVLPKLAALDGVVSTVESGEAFQAAGLDIRAYGGLHAEIHRDIPRVANLGYLISDGDTSVYHPGDSFDVPEGAVVDTLFVPVSGPWLKASESVDFIRAVKPRRAYALHDGLLNDAGGRLVDGVLGRLAGTEYGHLAPGTSIGSGSIGSH